MSSSEKFIKIPKIQIFQVLYHDVSYQSNRRWLCLFSKSNTITYLNISVTCHIGILRRWKDIFSVSDNPSFSPGPWTLKTVTLFHKTYISLVTYVREMKYQAQIWGSLQKVPTGMLKSTRNPKKISLRAENDLKWLFLAFYAKKWLIFQKYLKEAQFGW